ncbi:type II toxin-antitoxin system HicB family antitoxin [Pseudodonghicola flavimaris]|uniref:Type II toxin-antitoxin system HicB family antitoxin n=1 Tax=Pseudodonghicola flavimaris TaxID=3050036 RepID=A0ABT7EW78_9RHOB|nr:type II toxin-antitoxin system HicB family antitoxin [Pseudodonghicola flavimaris]MDK3016535.1 type II toxin-antitoxin system HicB family antitoxin [Pseudodonghicola flavimaris]
MRYYTAIVHRDEDSAYGLTFPDLPGCFAAADSWDAIPAAAAEALDLWFEDQPDVEPASLDEIRRRPEIAEELAQGAVMMPVPYIPADTALARVNISLERGLLRAIDETAKARGMTRSSFIASSARRELVGAA